MAGNAKTARRRALVPEFDLPPLLLETLVGYLGPRRAAKLTPEQRGFLTGIATTAALDVGEVLAGTYSPPGHATLRVEEFERDHEGPG